MCAFSKTSSCIFYTIGLLLFLSIFFGFTEASSQSKESTDETNEKTLRLVHLLYRHGDRSAHHIYTGDPVRWPQGLGQLTEKGMQQSFELGLFLRKRYLESGFMSLKYDHSQVYVRSTDKDRTLMTAYSVLAGLYPPNGTQVWNKDFPWQPIPVHTVPLVDDYLLRDDAPCPKFTKLVDEFRKTSKELRNFIIKNQDLIKLIHEKTGQPANAIGFFKVLDPVFCERQHEKDLNLTLPDWVKNDTIGARLREAQHFTSKIRFPTPEIARLRGGLLVKTVVENSDKTIKNDPDVKKMYMYSAHDTTANAFMRVMKVFNDLAPPYSSCVMVELHELSEGNYDVRIFYRNETNSANDTVFQLNIPDCGPEYNCSFQKFKSLMNNIMPDDIKKECGITNDDQQQVASSTSSGLVIGVAVLSCVVALLLVVVIGILVMFRKKQRHYTYRALPVDTI